MSTMSDCQRIMTGVRALILHMWAHTQNAAVLLRSQSFDASTDAGRSNERYRRAALAGIMASASRAIRLLNSIVAVPITIGYLGAERFGLWMSLSSLIALAF